MASRGRFVVSATNVPYLQWNLSEVPKTVRVTPEDIANGFVDLTGPILEVRTNNRNGFVVVFRLESGTFKSASIRGLDRDIELGSAGAFLMQPQASIAMRHAMKFRLTLEHGVTPGEYALPVSMTVHQPRT